MLHFLPADGKMEERKGDDKMRHIFVINPKAGKEKNREKFEANILAAGKKLNKKVEIYETTAAGDGEDFVRRTSAAKSPDEKIRFYACGGDGAVNEIFNGAYGFDNVEVGVIPMGTGNDFIRNFGTAEQFRDIEAQLQGEAVECDLIRYVEYLDGTAKQPRYCANMFNIGFDCNVVDQTAKAKKWPLINGSLAYLISVFIMLIKKKGANLRVEFEDGEVFDDKLLLMAIANGCYCGGGWRSNPIAALDDGIMDIGLIRDIPRRQFPALLPKYSKGTHLDYKGIEKILIYKKSRTLTITANGENMRLCTDGEITDAEKVTFEMVPDAIRVAVPLGAGA